MAELVFIHGAADSAAVWELQVEHFGRSHQVLAVDLPGHGPRLTEQAIDSIDGIADEVARQIEARGLTRPVLVGHSMGGAATLTIALRRPELPLALVLAASGARLRMRPIYIENARAKAEASPRGQRVERQIPSEQVLSTHASEDVRAWLQQRFGQATAQATYADFFAVDHFDVMGRLHEVRQPALIIGGEDDLWTPPRFQHYFAEHLPSARLVMLPQTGHYPFVEQATTFNAELHRFLTELPIIRARRSGR